MSEERGLYQRDDRGLYPKYRVERTDGNPVGRVFVLEPEKDAVARRALSAYAEAVHDTDPDLASDLRLWLSDLARLWPSAEPDRP